MSWPLIVDVDESDMANTVGKSDELVEYKRWTLLVLIHNVAHIVHVYMDRPVTSKSRGICRYYSTPRGCFAGNDCKFLHGADEQLTPYDKSKVCKYYAKGTLDVSTFHRFF